MACENDYFVATILEPYRSVDNQSFSTSNAQIGVKKDYCLSFSLLRHGHYANAFPDLTGSLGW